MKLLVIGRDPNLADIVLKNEYVSLYHAEIIQLDNGDMFLIDKSSNGTFLNGSKVISGKEIKIRRGDDIKFACVPLDWALIKDIQIPDGVKEVIEIGSHYMNNVQLTNPRVSRFHATMRRMKDNKWYICDHSTNGTTINGNPIPKQSYVRFKHGDKISCAGVEVPNPAKRNNTPFALIAILLVAGLACFGLIKYKHYSDEELSHMYSNSVLFVTTSYHFETDFGSLENLIHIADIKKRYDKFIVDTNGFFEQYELNNANYSTAVGNGFYVGNNTIVTSRRIARPWEYNDYINQVEKRLKAELNTICVKYYPNMITFISEVKIKGVVDNIHVYPNDVFVDQKNAINCQELSVSDEADLAALTVRSLLPQSIEEISLNKISTNTLSVGSHVLTLYYRYLSPLNESNKSKVKVNPADGIIFGVVGDDLFKVNISANNNATGAPIFNNKGKLIGVVSSYDAASKSGIAVGATTLRKMIQK